VHRAVQELDDDLRRAGVQTSSADLVAGRTADRRWLTRLAPGENVSLVLETAEASFVIAGETVFSTHDIRHNVPALQQAGVRYRWDGEESYGMLERSNPLDKISN
jgi:predicted transcriptional regulator of viral defense system